MKKLIIQTLLVFSFVPIYSQVGINTRTPNSSLEIKAKSITNPAITEGLLIPRVEMLALNPMPGIAQDGMMIYLSKDFTDTSVTPNLVYSSGLYYWDWNYNTNSGAWLRYLSTIVSTSNASVFRSLSAGKIAIGDINSSNAVGTTYNPDTTANNIANVTLLKTGSQSAVYRVNFAKPLQSSQYLSIVTLESKGIEADLPVNNSTINNDGQCFVPGTADYKTGSFIVSVNCNSGGTNNLVLNVIVYDLMSTSNL